MYYQSSNRGSRHGFSQRGGYSPRGRSFGGGNGARRIKTFDPSQIVNLPPRIDDTKEYVVTHQFSDFEISDIIKRNVISKGYSVPTPIQDQAIPHILEGRDLIGMANTGTGKTAAFLIPLIQKVLEIPNQRVLIISPTRELAAQTRDELISFTKGLDIYSALCIGGANMWRQKEELKRNPSFVIGTPGRLMDHIRNHSLNLNYFESVVLDEADRMVDDGFLPEIRQIVSMLPENRQSLFFSATVNEKVRWILQSFVYDPVTVSVKSGDITENIKQEIVSLPDPKLQFAGFSPVEIPSSCEFARA